MTNLDQLLQAIRDGRIDTVIVCFPDLYGRPVGKRITGPFFIDTVAAHGTECCDYLLGSDIDLSPLPGYQFANWERGYGDVAAQLDPEAVFFIPWQEKTALVLCDLFTNAGEPVDVSPRAILKAQLDRAKERGLGFTCATELEFYLFQETFEEANQKNYQDLKPNASYIEDYQILQTSRDEFLLGRIRREMLAAGLPVESSKGEAGRGQHEVNLTYSDALTAADRHTVFKNGIKEIAAQEGRAVTFMAKWSMDEAGSSCHLHTGLIDLATNKACFGDDTAPDGISAIGQHFLAGQLAAAQQLAWLWAPTVNSYRRFVPDSWAPTAIAWGEDNRTCGFRIVGHGSNRRVENRVPGADANPYLALAAAIAAGLYGIDHKLPLGAAYNGNAYTATDVERIPSTIVEAMSNLEASEIAREAFGEEVHHHLVNTARQEWLASNRVVTDWELRRNFERI
jgi:glutamine synthetase